MHLAAARVVIQSLLPKAGEAKDLNDPYLGFLRGSHLHDHRLPMAFPTLGQPCRQSFRQAFRS